MAELSSFQKLDIRVGKIIEVKDFPEAKNPSYKLKINFGENIGIKKSCAQLTENYNKENLINKFVLGIVNLPPRQIGPAVSEVLILGVPDKENKCILIKPDKKVKLGAKLY